MTTVLDDKIAKYREIQGSKYFEVSYVVRVVIYTPSIAI